MPSPHQISTVITPAKSLWLIDLDAALDELGLTSDGGSVDNQVGRMIGQVSAAINNYCNRVFVRQSYRDQFRNFCSASTYGSPLMLSQAPVAADTNGDLVLTVSEDGNAVDTTEWEVFASIGMLYRLNSSGGPASWSGSLIVVDYDAGYDLIPDDVQSAAMRWLSMRYSTRGRDTQLKVDEAVGVQRYEYFQVGAGTIGVPPEISETLSPYRLWVI